MAEQILLYNSLTNLNSTEGELTVIVKNLDDQAALLRDQITQNQKILHQLRIQNMYKASENDFIIDENIFENDELD
jgi:hypothetical protein